MKLSETSNVMPMIVSVGPSVDGPELRLTTTDSLDISVEIEAVFNRQTAAEFLPILQHFIATGELPE